MAHWWHRVKKSLARRNRPFRRTYLAVEALETRALLSAAPASHVLILSVDGLHQADIADPALASSLTNVLHLASSGVTYTNAFTTSPSDSFPGTLSYLTGALPGTTGVFYDDSYSRTLLPPGSDTSATPGTEVQYAENVDKDQTLLSGGGNFDASSIDPAQLPVDPQTGTVVYPNAFLQVNTIFDVAHQAGLYTAFSDKHPAYQIANGDNPRAINDFYAPEVNSNTALYDPTTGTTINADALLNSSAPTPAGLTVTPGYTVRTFANDPAGSSAPDSIAVDGTTVYVGFGNGGAADGSGGAMSTIVQYSVNGQVEQSWTVVGHNDGLKVNPVTHQLWALQNEDANPNLVVIDPVLGTMTRFSLAPVNGGGYDDIAFLGSQAFLSASNPSKNPNTDPAVVQVTLLAGGTTRLTPVLLGNATAKNLVTGKTVTLNLQDPDSMTTDRAGNLVLTSQADNELVTIHNPGTGLQSVTVLPLSDAANNPVSVDDTLANPGSVGEMLVTDQKAGTIDLITVPAGSAAQTYAAAQDIGQVGRVNFATGRFTPVISGLSEPKGLAFLNAGAFADLSGYTLVDASTDPVDFDPTTGRSTDPNLELTTNSALLTQRYDDLKVRAILNEIAGQASHPSAGVTHPQVPALFGMNFQAVSVAQKDFNGGIALLPNGQEGFPSAILEGALQHTDESIGKIVAALKAAGLWNSTDLYVLAKHGQAPRVGHGGLMADSTLPNLLAAAGAPVAQATQDNVSLLWLQDQSTTDAAVTALQNFKATGTLNVFFQGVAQTLPASQVINQILSGPALVASGLGDPATDSTTPDIIVTLNPGYIWVGNPLKFAHKNAEHGGFTEDSTHIALIVVGGALPAGVRGTTVSSHVDTTQIAVSALNALGLNAARLQGAVIDGTKGLPGLGLATGVLLHATAGKRQQQLVGAFFDPSAIDDLAGYKAKVTWGDDSKTTRNVIFVRDASNPNIVYVYANHKYTTAGTFDGTVEITTPAGTTIDDTFEAEVDPTGK
jgi:hypothetical protein